MYYLGGERLREVILENETKELSINSEDCILHFPTISVSRNSITPIRGSPPACAEMWTSSANGIPPPAAVPLLLLNLPFFNFYFIHAEDELSLFLIDRSCESASTDA